MAPRRKLRPELLELSVERPGPGRTWQKAVVRWDKAVVWIPVADDEWAMTVEVFEQGGQPVIGKLTFEPIGELPRGGLPARAARVPFGLIYDTTRDLVRKAGIDDESGTVARFAWVEKEPLQRQPGRRPRPDLDYARVAAAYLTAIERGSRRPVELVAGAMGEDRVFIRDMLSEARRRGLLTKPPTGQPGGQLTPKAKAILAEAKNMPPRGSSRRGRDTERGTSRASKR